MSLPEPTREMATISRAQAGVLAEAVRRRVGFPATLRAPGMQRPAVAHSATSESYSASEEPDP